MTCVRAQLTLKIVGQSFFSVLSQLAMGLCMALMAPKISPLNEFVILLMAKSFCFANSCSNSPLSAKAIAPPYKLPTQMRCEPPAGA